MGIGLQEIILLVVIIFVIAGVALARRGGKIHFTGSTLVLRKFKIDESAPDGVCIEIVGRASGITAWLLTVMGFEAESSLKVTDTNLSFKSSSLSGEFHQVVPMPSISSTHCGYSKPIGYLILGIVFVMIFIIGGFLLGCGPRYGGGHSGVSITLPALIIGIIFLIVYWLSKKIIISIETSGGLILGLSFKRSVIENISIDTEKALQVIGIVNKKVIKSQI